MLAYERMLAGPKTSPVYLPLLENARARLALVQALEAIDENRPEEARRLLERAIRDSAAPPPELALVLERLTSNGSDAARPADSDSSNADSANSDSSNPPGGASAVTGPNAQYRSVPESSWILRDPTFRSLEAMRGSSTDDRSDRRR